MDAPDDVLDSSQVEDLRSIDDGVMLARLVRMYLAKAPERIQQLRTHLAAANLAGIVSEAHALKGSSGSIGAARVAEACRRIEQAARVEGALPGDDQMIALEAEFGRAREALRRFAGPG